MPVLISKAGGRNRARTNEVWFRINSVARFRPLWGDPAHWEGWLMACAPDRRNSPALRLSVKGHSGWYGLTISNSLRKNKEHVFIIHFFVIFLCAIDYIIKIKIFYCCFAINKYLSIAAIAAHFLEGQLSIWNCYATSFDSTPYLFRSIAKTLVIESVIGIKVIPLEGTYYVLVKEKGPCPVAYIASPAAVR